MIEYRTAVRSYTGLKNKHPIVVHCSAGVGRTGTFIALDRLFRAVDHADLENLDVRAIVANMRHSRTMMVQALPQYEYIHKTLKDYMMQQLRQVKQALATKATVSSV